MKLLITLEGKKYQVDVEILHNSSAEEMWDEEANVPIPESVLLPPLLPDTRETDKICRCPIAGAIVAVLVSVGSKVQENSPVLIIDAMKMQTTVGAPVAGTIVEVHVKPGDSVKPGQVLCRVE